MHTVLVLGGYGFFGGRICQMLAADENIYLHIGGLNITKGKRLPTSLV